MQTLSVILSVMLAASVHTDEPYKNPVDGKIYAPERGWRTYKPKDGAPYRLEKVSLGSVRLLQDNDTMSWRTTPDAIAAFIQASVAVGVDVFESQPTRLTVLVQFTCTPGSHSVQLAYDGVVSEELMQRFYDSLAGLPLLKVSDEVRFQFSVEIVP